MSKNAVRPRAILADPISNRGSAFTPEERRKEGIVGRLPSAVQTLDQQAQRAYAQLQAQPGDLAKNVHMEQLHDRNEILYYRLLIDHLAELLPIVYDPTVARRSSCWSHEYRQPAGRLPVDRPPAGRRATSFEELWPRPRRR